MRYGDLKDQFNTPHPRLHLHCAACTAEYSAHAGDYFMQRDTDQIVCGACGSRDVFVARTVTQLVREG